MIDRRSQRGAALLLVMVSIAVVTALTLDLAYQTRVSLQLAANARDELRATALAKSAVSVSRLVLHFQAQLDGVSGAAAQVASAAAPKPGAAASPQGAAPDPLAALAGAAGLGGLGALGGIRLWELVPVDSALVPLLLGGGGDGGGGDAPGAAAAAPAAGEAGAGEAPAGEAARRAFGDFEGAFQATIEDEDRKINVRQLNGVGALPIAQVARLAELLKDPKYDFLFDRDDANGLRVSRADLVAALKDWVDEDEQGSVLGTNPAQPFEQGFSDENALYGRLEDRYEAKNAWFDSLAELFMVAGVGDTFMAAFGDQLTVFPDVNAQINVNATSPAELLLNALVMSEPPGVPQPALLDPAFPQKLSTALALARPLPFMSMSPQQFAGVLDGLGVKVQPAYLQATTDPGRVAFGTRSTTFRIRATGVAGDVKKEIQAVVLFDRRAGPLAQDLGRLVHWHEE
jgi:general secretion pathway protein K